jgi:hypothetical protein
MVSGLEYSSDARGAYVLGRVDAGVLYARLQGAISTELAQRFVERFSACLGDGTGMAYFADSSDVVCYDRAAAWLVMDAVRSQRHRLRSIVARPWRGAVSRKATSFADAFGRCQYVTNALEFEARLRAVAPCAAAEVELILASLGWKVSWSDADAEPCDAHGYAYLFDLSNFEDGRFVATRLEQVGQRPSGCWVCLARNDEQALRLARQAASTDWARPRSRLAEAFTVQFVHSSRLGCRGAAAGR